MNHVPSARQQEIATENAQTSPLLRLPPEIRNRIYEAAFCDNVIHVSVRNCRSDEPGALFHDEYFGADQSPSLATSVLTLRITHSLCTRFPGHDDAIYELSKQPSAIPEDEGLPREYAERHAPCYRGVAHLKQQATNNFAIDSATCTRYPPLSLTLLRTCRQIHNEASLLPYTNNTFAFHESQTFNLFISRTLTPPQKAAISTIHIDSHYQFSRNLREIDRSAVLSLTGLRTLHFCFSSPSSPLPPRWYGTYKKRFQLDVAPVLEFGLLRDVVFKATINTHDDYGRRNRAHRRAQAVEWEEALTKGYEVQDAEGNGKKRKAEGNGKKRKADGDEDGLLVPRGAQWLVCPKPRTKRAQIRARARGPPPDESMN